MGERVFAAEGIQKKRIRKVGGLNAVFWEQGDFERVRP